MMISTHFDLQNIIKQLDHSSSNEEGLLKPETDEFSIAMSKIMESNKNDKTLHAADSQFLDGSDALPGELISEAEQSGKEIEEEQLSGNLLPPVALPHSPIEQILLGGKRQILVGRSSIDQLQMSLRAGAKQAGNPLELHTTTTGKNSIDLSSLTKERRNNSELKEGEHAQEFNVDDELQESIANHRKVTGKIDGSGLVPRQAEIERRSFDLSSLTKERRNNSELKEGEHAQEFNVDDELQESIANHRKVTGKIDGSGLVPRQAEIERRSLLAAPNQAKRLADAESEKNLLIGAVQSSKFDSADRVTQTQRLPEMAAEQFNAKEFNDNVIKIYKSHLDSSNIAKNTAVKIFLSPESLGQVQLDIVSEGSELRVTIGADRTEIVNLMRLNANSLQEQLSSEYSGKVALDINEFKGENSNFQGQNQNGARDKSGDMSSKTESQNFEDENGATNLIRNASTSLFDTFV